MHDVLVDTGAELSWFPAEVLEALGIERFSWNRPLGSSSTQGRYPLRQSRSAILFST